MKLWISRLMVLLCLPFLLVAAYLVAALFGAVIPASHEMQVDKGEAKVEPVYLLGTLLHTDIAIPVNSLTLQQFSFLQDAGIPLDNPDLKYLVFGWGSRVFYPQTASYSDIKVSVAWKAISGDDSVMHVAPTGDLGDVEGIRKLEMGWSGFANLLEFIRKGFSEQNGEPVLLPFTYGYGDVFYESPEHFNILNPCNTWTSAALQEAGFGTGIWTPTSYSLHLAHWLHN